VSGKPRGGRGVDAGFTPGNAFENPRQHAIHSDQGIAAVLRRREHRIAAAAQPSGRAPQVGGPQRRAVAPHQDHRTMALQRRRECALHALAEIGATL